MNTKDNIIIIGYSGHGFVICDICELLQYHILGYCENSEKSFNPYQLDYLGNENDNKNLELLQKNDYFIGIGDNRIRYKIQSNLLQKDLSPATTLIHPKTSISKNATIGYGTLVAANVAINPLAKIGNGVVCNTSSVIEHEVQLGDYAFVGPNATLLGAVEVGDFSFIGANAVVKQGVKIGKNVIVGAGAVILKDVPDNAIVVGNPHRILKKQPK